MKERLTRLEEDNQKMTADYKTTFEKMRNDLNPTKMMSLESLSR